MSLLTEEQKQFGISNVEMECERALYMLEGLIHRDNKKWWIDINTGEPLQRNVGEMLALIHSEVSEALEAHRKDLMDDKLPHRKGIEVELADAIIRILDLSCGLDLNLPSALVEKLRYNRTREDHKVENRLKEGGKKY